MTVDPGTLTGGCGSCGIPQLRAPSAPPGSVAIAELLGWITWVVVLLVVLCLMVWAFRMMLGHHNGYSGLAPLPRLRLPRRSTPTTGPPVALTWVGPGQVEPPAAVRPPVRPLPASDELEGIYTFQQVLATLPVDVRLALLHHDEAH